jgi:cytochrome P450
VSYTQSQPAWHVSGHEWVRELLADPRLSCSHPNPGHPVRLTQPGLFGGPIPDPEREPADLGTLIERKRWVGGDDVISDLIHAATLDPSLTDDGIAHLAAGLVFAGHAPVVAIIDRGILLLLTHSEQREALQRDSALAASAVEEIFRFASPIERLRAVRRGGLTRYASVDITRERIPHLSLSHGAHFCLGAHLARAVLQYLFVRLLERFPTLRLAPYRSRRSNPSAKP